MNFQNIIGQEEVVGLLRKSVSEDRVGHAYIFTGPVGIGKKTIAHEFAGLLLCQKPGGERACGSCLPCLMYMKDSNPDLMKISTEEASIGVDSIRELQADVAIKPRHSARKVYIIEDADKMTDQAQNCLLKTFEEPPQYVVVILTASNYERLLDTIKSRAQRVNFKRYTDGQVLKAVTEKLGSTPEQARLAVDYSDGNIGLALELAGSERFKLLRNSVFELTGKAAKGRTDSIMELISLFEENKERADLILDIMLHYYRDILVVLETGNEKILINSDKRDIIISNARGYSSRKVIESIGAIEETRRALKSYGNFTFAIDNMLNKFRED